MPNWTVAGVQMDCTLGDIAGNRSAVVAKLHQAADRGAKLVVFPECVLTGYGFESREDTRKVAEPLPGPSTDAVASACAKLGVWSVFGLLRSRAGGQALQRLRARGAERVRRQLPQVAPPVPRRRPVHGPRRPAVRRSRHRRAEGWHEHLLRRQLPGILPHPHAARRRPCGAADQLDDELAHDGESGLRGGAWENHIYYLAVNRVGDETGYRYLGLSSCAGLHGQRAALGAGV